MEFRLHIIKDGAALSEWTEIHPIGDLHVGNPNHDKRALAEKVKMIKDRPNALWIGTGDMMEMIFIGDKRWSKKTEDEKFEIRRGVMDEVREAASVLYPIKDQCVGIMEGNHEFKIATMMPVDPAVELCSLLRVKYLGYSSMIRFRKAKRSVIYYLHHGYGGGRKAGTQINKAEDALRICPYANFYILSHVHMNGLTDLDTLDITEQGSPIHRPKVFVVLSGFVKNYEQKRTSYPERLMFPQGNNSPCVTKFRWVGKKHELQLGINFQT